jgi:hypothetical protein
VTLWAILIAVGAFIGAASILAGTDALYEWALEAPDER